MRIKKELEKRKILEILNSRMSMKMQSESVILR